MWEQGFKVFSDLLRKYAADEATILNFWREIDANYNNNGRHYHTLSHLRHVHGILSATTDTVDDPDAVLFALFYHDLIYDVLSNDNEIKSAATAQERLTSIGAAPATVKRCVSHILATQGHEPSADHDTNTFTDADLAILGSHWELYESYAMNVRKEFGIYPDLIYNRGRRKVLKRFLEMERIYKTDFCFNLYDLQARRNLSKELTMLQ